MEADLSIFEHKGVKWPRIRAVETAINLLAAGFIPVEVKETINPVKVIADFIEQALGVEGKEKQ